jgi:hypothetical protein
MKRTFSNLILLAGAALSANAQMIWNSSAVAAVPFFRADGTQSFRTWDPGANGKGLRLKDMYIGVSYAYLDVSAPNGATFRKIQLRAEGSVSGAVRAEFFKQRRDADPGGAILIGGVTTVGGGFQFVASGFAAAEVIDRLRWSYYVRLTLRRDVGLGAPTAYDVTLIE